MLTIVLCLLKFDQPLFTLIFYCKIVRFFTTKSSWSRFSWSIDVYIGAFIIMIEMISINSNTQSYWWNKRLEWRTSLADLRLMIEVILIRKIWITSNVRTKAAIRKNSLMLLGLKPPNHSNPFQNLSLYIWSNFEEKINIRYFMTSKIGSVLLFSEKSAKGWQTKGFFNSLIEIVVYT